MNQLDVPKGRRRGLSVNSITDARQRAMNDALNNLQDDLTHVESQWNRILTEKSNPLELALAFLDDTSVGLGHRYEDFRQLKTRIGYDLKEAVNEHFQVLNSTVASYGIAVESITNAQDSITQLKNQIGVANKNITMKKGHLRELNEESRTQAEMVDVLSAIEKLLQLPEKIEEHIRKSEYEEAQKLLAHGFLSANSYNLWSLSTLQILKQQLELQEHVLFNTLIEEIHGIIYTKTGLSNNNENILDDIGLTLDGFTSLENYIYNVVNVDVQKQSNNMGKRLTDFMEQMRTPGFRESKSFENDSGFGRLFYLLTIINDINKLPNALNILSNRAKEEFHNIILKCTEEIRMNHPSVLKVAASLTDDDFGISVKDALSVVIRRNFFKIFVKLLLSAQGHRVVFETVQLLLPSTTASTIYRFDLVWSKLLDEIEALLSRYLYNANLTKSNNLHYGGSKITDSTKKNEAALFNFQNNIKDSFDMIDHTNNLKTLLKDIFPGIDISTNAELESIYIEEESFEQEDSLIPPSVFNMKVILEPFLIFCQSTSKLIPSPLLDSTKPSMKFFVHYMNDVFFPKLEITFTNFFTTRIEEINPYSLEPIEENRYICKNAADFRNLLFRLLYVMNTTNNFRKKICHLILKFLRKFLDYYVNHFEKIFGIALSTVSKRIITVWLEDVNITKMENQILGGEKTALSQEAEALMNQCQNFSKKEMGLKREDLLNSITVDAVISFLSTTYWILGWLPGLKKVVKTSSNSDGLYDPDHLRNAWSFFEPNDLRDMDKMTTPKISMDIECSREFDEIVQGFLTLRNRLLSSLRFDTRARCIYYIGGLFQNTRSWDSEVDSVELDEHITYLMNDMRMLENKYKQQIPEDVMNITFTGIDKLNNLAFLRGMHSIHVLNKNGIKTILKNISVLQHTCRNLLTDPSSIDMSDALNLYSLCGSDEKALFDQISSGRLKMCTTEDLKTILRLQFSEELKKQVQRNSSGTKRINSMPLNSKKYYDALKQLEALQ